ncbi:MAG: MarR family transcriptional regulator [Balneolaceae bacterium]
MKNDLYITSNALARKISSMADERFKPFGITTSYAYLLLAIYNRPGIGQKQICEEYHFAPSTVTRFMDKLEKKNLIVRKKNGKAVIPELTQAGREISIKLSGELRSLNREIEKTLGSRFMDTFNRMIEHGLKEFEKKDP